MEISRGAQRYSAVGVGAVLLISAVIIAATRGSAQPSANAATATSTPIPIRDNPVIGPFQGLGVWVDVWDSTAWAHPGAAINDMAAHGVRTLYLETSNYNRPAPFADKAGVIAFLDAAKRAHIRVIAWYLPGFVKPSEDVKRSLAAIRFRTPAGNAFTGFGLDIESPAVSNVALRTERLLSESASLRTQAGPSYPLAAIIPQPLGMVHNPTYWPGFPYQNLASTYDVMMPMTYFSWKTHGTNGAHQIVNQNIELIRQNVGDDQVPIHVIGGIAQESTLEATLGFVRSIRENGIIGASSYTWPGITTGQWKILAGIRPNPVQDPVLPVPLGPGELGNIPGSDTSHPNEVVYHVGGKPGDRILTLSGYDAGTGEVRIYANWALVTTLQAGPADVWGSPTSILISDALLNDVTPNTIEVVATTGATWGVRDVGMTKP
ncbi:MAG: hypothetical protein QOE83_2790 [Actinomycetota bacterium]|jgi:hypothetical protein|nr:hypothetical protein [Actinomycetota bacterium]